MAHKWDGEKRLYFIIVSMDRINNNHLWN
jgi:hypothetical protein